VVELQGAVGDVPVDRAGAGCDDGEPAASAAGGGGDVAASGIRRSLALEFHDVYVFNLRGNARSSGEQRRAEGDNVFHHGSRNTVAVTLLVRRPEPLGSCSIHYRDIGDYLDRTAKLSIVAASNLSGEGWVEIEPNASGDWVNKSSGGYDRLVPLAGEHDAVFLTPSTGLKTSRDAWSFNSSADALRSNMTRTVTWFNAEVSRLAALPAPPAETLGGRAERYRAAARFDETNFSWNYGDFDRAARGERYRLDGSMLRTAIYRPFFKQMVAFDRTLVRSPSQMPKRSSMPQLADT
jgi:predicted helicase